MHQVTKVIYFCYGHRLMDYEGRCRHLHGHNGRVEIQLESETLDRRGMVVDFGDISKAIKSWIDENLDHQMLLRSDDPLIPFLKMQKEPHYVMKENPTAENIAKLIYDYTRSKDFPVNQVTLWESESSFATYTFCHSRFRGNDNSKKNNPASTF